jgi:Fur family ferric uptake transcriptional regulator
MNLANENRLQIKNLRNFLHQRGLKYTQQREAVWWALQNLKASHPTTEDIFHQSRAISPRLSWATVYRTLRRMKELGIIVQRDFRNGRSRYELGGRDLFHGHLICRRCGKVIEVKDRSIENFWKEASRKFGFEVFQERVEGYGLCSECEKKER